MIFKIIIIIIINNIIIKESIHCHPNRGTYQSCVIGTTCCSVVTAAALPGHQHSAHVQCHPDCAGLSEAHQSQEADREGA